MELYDERFVNDLKQRCHECYVEKKPLVLDDNDCMKLKDVLGYLDWDKNDYILELKDKADTEYFRYRNLLGRVNDMREELKSLDSVTVKKCLEMLDAIRTVA